MTSKLSRNELIELGERVLAHDGTEQEVDEWLDIIQSNVPHPEVGNLMFQSELSVEEIIDLALAYQPVPLGPSSLESPDEQSDN